MMMTIKLSQLNSLRSVSYRALATQAHHAEGHHHEKLSPQQMKVTTLPNGMVVASLENYSPISRVGVFFKAGARYEHPDELGITHALRNAAGLSTNKSTVFGITRNLEFVGARLSAMTTRDHLIYVLENIRDHTEKNLHLLSHTITEPAFKPWELSDFLGRQKVDRAMLNETPQLKLIETLHRTAYRGGLGNGLFTPEYMLGKHDRDMLLKYVDSYFTSNRAAIIGLGVDHDRLLEQVDKKFPMPTGDRGGKGESKYVGGETRVDTNSDMVYVSVAAEGASAKNQKDMLSLSLFQHMLGSGPRVKYSLGTATKLGQAALKAAESPCAVQSLNVSYSDSGLFGFSLVCSAKEAHKVVKAVVTQLRESAKTISEQDLKNAKNALKATIFFSYEDQDNLYEDMGTQALTYGNVFTPQEIEKAIDSISLQDVSSITSKVIKGKGVMSAVGKLYNVPYLEDLV